MPAQVCTNEPNHLPARSPPHIHGTAKNRSCHPPAVPPLQTRPRPAPPDPQQDEDPSGTPARPRTLRTRSAHSPSAEHCSGSCTSTTSRGPHRSIHSHTTRSPNGTRPQCTCCTAFVANSETHPTANSATSPTTQRAHVSAPPTTPQPQHAHPRATTPLAAVKLAGLDRIPIQNPPSSAHGTRERRWQGCCWSRSKYRRQALSPGVADWWPITGHTQKRADRNADQRTTTPAWARPSLSWPPSYADFLGATPSLAKLSAAGSQESVSHARTRCDTSPRRFKSAWQP